MASFDFDSVPPGKLDAYRVMWLEECIALSAFCQDLALAGKVARERAAAERGTGP